MKSFIILFFGPPGSGKSTQAELVAAAYQAAHLDTGALLRRIFSDPLRQSDPKIQEERIKHEIQGQLNDSVWVAGLVIEEVRKFHAANKSIVSSGFPRTIFEAEIELPVFQELFSGRIFVVKLEVSESTTLSRNSNRRMCSSCGKIFSSLGGGGDHPALCSLCGGKLVVRPDDTLETIKHRLQVYQKQTLPLFAYFAEKNIREIVVDGEPAPDAVFDSIRSALDGVL
ncbi:MAG TPA: nucleoside monophosphate kinase [Candidatus Paceibacterota bacterium]